MLESNREVVTILGIDIDSAPKSNLLRQISAHLLKFSQFEAKKPILITTPNPEQVILAQKDPEFKKIINSADITLPDGVGLVLANKFLNFNTPKNKLLKSLTLIIQGLIIGLSLWIKRDWLEKEFRVIQGSIFFKDLVTMANKRKWRIFLLGATSGVAAKTKEKLERSYKKVKIIAEVGPFVNKAGYPLAQNDKWAEEDVIKKINTFKPHLLFVAFGAPKAEKWLYRHIAKLNVGAGMVVGGTFDYIAGVQKIPPKTFQNLGIEWLWRLFAGTQNIKRIFTATVVFPFQVYKEKLIQ